MRYAAIERLSASHLVRRLCRVLGASASGFYCWKRRGQTARAREDRQLKQEILAVHGASGGRYGTPRVERELRRQGTRTSRKRVARLRRELGLRARGRRRYKATTDSRHAHPVAPNRLERRFEAQQADQVWVGDLTYLRSEDGWLYLAVLMDTFSRRIVGWAVSESLEPEVAIQALEKALETRRPSCGLLHHTDRGSQYASGAYRDLLARHGLVASMSRRGNCWDNAMAESFFKTLKAELGSRFQSLRHARRELFGYIEGFYNTRRLHSGLDYRSPAEHERLAAEAA